MASASALRRPIREQRARFTYLSGGKPRGRPTAAPRLRLLPRVKPRYKRIGQVMRASNKQYNFTVRRIQHLQSNAIRVLVGRTNRETKETVWHIMTRREYNEKFVTQRNHAKRNHEGGIQVLTTSVSMLAKNPEMFTNLGHEIGKGLIHLLAMAA